jgi:hypothetical protein
MVALCMALGSSPAAADLWRWIDADGVVRYTPNPNRVPAGARSSLARVEAGMAAAPAAPRAPAPPVAAAPIYAPADEFSFEADPFNAPDQARTLRGSDVPEPLEAGATTPLDAERSPSAAAEPAAAPSATPAATRTQALEAALDAPSRPALDAAQSQRRAELLAQIERDETALKEMISGSASRSGAPGDELRAIAERLPQLQEELRVLEGGATGGSGSQQP